MAVTIRQIAAAAGVSRGTVDRALHHRPGVKPEIAERVRHIAGELGFEPNRAGKVLAARKTPICIGCFLPGIGNDFFTDVVAGFRRAEADLADFGVSIRLRQVAGFDAHTHAAALRELAQTGCSALCVSTMDTPEIRGAVDEIIEAGVPVVTVNTDLTRTKRLCYVGCDYALGGRTAAGLLTLITRGRLDLLIVTGSRKVRGHNDRIRGFLHTLVEKKRSCCLAAVIESQDSDAHAYAQTCALLKLQPQINCIYVAAAGIAGVCGAVTELGRDILILTHDETASTMRLVREGVIACTIGQEPQSQGYHAVHLLFDYLMDDRRTAPHSWITGTMIKIRENSG